MLRFQPFRPALRAITNAGGLRSFIVPTKEPKSVNVYKPEARLIQKGSSPVLKTQEFLYNQHDPEGWRRKLVDRSNPECLKAGDIVKVVRKDKSSFIGLLLAINRKQLSTNILLRNKIGGVGVEVRYHLFNPMITSVEVVRTPLKRKPRSKLYFVRGSVKYDAGDLDAEVRRANRKARQG